MSKTNNGLVSYAKKQVGKPYWYGTFGQVGSEQLYKNKQKQYPKYYTSTDFCKQYGQRVHDCVGLIKGYLWSSNDDAKPKYNALQDVSAKGMYFASTAKGTMETFPASNGILVFKGTTAGNIHHVGIYCNNDYVYEAKGHEYGVVKTKFNKKDWQFWSKCPYIKYKSANIENNETTTTINYNIAKEVIQGKWGCGSIRKQKLLDAGYDYKAIQAIVNSMIRG